jgi:hypothetical protein
VLGEEGRKALVGRVEAAAADNLAEQLDPRIAIEQLAVEVDLV